mmetsp:Transcript_110070/g.355263  ORF Transcript_110070/g.355263 Transcript_110070/m.355263 type:complete len:237 (-) Transcript_110070:8-718(-)
MNSSSFTSPLRSASMSWNSKGASWAAAASMPVLSPSLACAIACIARSKPALSSLPLNPAAVSKATRMRFRNLSASNSALRWTCPTTSRTAARVLASTRGTSKRQSPQSARPATAVPPAAAAASVGPERPEPSSAHPVGAWLAPQSTDAAASSGPAPPSLRAPASSAPPPCPAPAPAPPPLPAPCCSCPPAPKAPARGGHAGAAAVEASGCRRARVRCGRASIIASAVVLRVQLRLP